MKKDFEKLLRELSMSGALEISDMGALMAEVADLLEDTDGELPKERRDQMMDLIMDSDNVVEVFTDDALLGNRILHIFDKPDIRRQRTNIECVETGDVYDSMTAAAKAVMFSVPAISKAVLTGGACAGYHWRRTDRDATVARAESRARTKPRNLGTRTRYGFVIEVIYFPAAQYYSASTYGVEAHAFTEVDAVNICIEEVRYAMGEVGTC